MESFASESANDLSVLDLDLSVLDVDLVLERWFSKLGVGWVLNVADGTPSGELEHDLDASRWIPALTEIVDTFRLITSRFLPSRDSAEEEELATESKEQLCLSVVR